MYTEWHNIGDQAGELGLHRQAASQATFSLLVDGQAVGSLYRVDTAAYSVHEFRLEPTGDIDPAASRRVLVQLGRAPLDGALPAHHLAGALIDCVGRGLAAGARPQPKLEMGSCPLHGQLPGQDRNRGETMLDRAIVTVKGRRGPVTVNTRHLLMALGLVALLGAALVGWNQMARGARQWIPGTMPNSAEMEEKFGVRFSFLAVTADGGMVELRYRVIDEGKAANFGHYTETAPMLVSEDSGKIVDVTIMGLHNHRVEPGRTYYVLYRNTASAIQSGRPVTIAVGDTKLEHVVPW